MSAANVMTQAEIKKLVRKLIDLGEDLEAKEDPRWYDVACAAAALDGIPLSLIAIAPLHQPRREVSHV